ncbi:stress responsive A/B barrel domain protein [Aspergillus rambellii]|uniref:Stress responsive A/B barrel domain protein n=1 Tax=Aspergillus rambellii TaxID=308745 RepID=A0A0F8X0R0_9EURO|nr:stress responsive A/B barrel domain protein [Aspergillus rambellii]
MPVYHIVLFHLKQGVTPAQLETWSQLAQGMVGNVPGLVSLKTGQPLPICVPRARGFDMGIVAVMERPEDVAEYAVHPAHLE